MLNLGTPDENSVPFITEIFENMECDEETYVVLDNFQEMQIPFVKQLLEVFTKHGAEKLHVVIVTQQLSLEGTLAIRQNHKVNRVRVSDLKFTKDDVSAYYKQAGLRITPEQLDSVYSRSDGWIAALYWQLLAFVQTGRFGSDDIEKLIQTAMWGKLSPDEQNILLALSVFPSFSLPQAEFVTDRSLEITGTILDDNPFIRFDSDTRHYHMHSILRTYLLGVFKDKPEEVKKTIYMRGGDWFRKTSSYINALRFYHMADTDDAYEKIFALPLTSLDVADNSVGEDRRHARR